MRMFRENIIGLMMARMSKSGMGEALPRLEDERFLMGWGRFADDLSPRGVAYARVVRSPHAHAGLGSIDTVAGSLRFR